MASRSPQIWMSTTSWSIPSLSTARDPDRWRYPAFSIILFHVPVTKRCTEGYLIRQRGQGESVKPIHFPSGSGAGAIHTGIQDLLHEEERAVNACKRHRCKPDL